MSVRIGQIVKGSLFNEPMRVEIAQESGDGTWVLGLVGTRSERFRRVTLTTTDLSSLTIIEPEMTFRGDGSLLRLGIQAFLS